MDENPPVRAWLSAGEASRLVGRSAFTIRDWRLRGVVRGRKRRDVWEYEYQSLRMAVRIMEQNYARRRIVPGPGRGKWDSKDQGALW